MPSLNKTGVNWFEVQRLFSSDQPAVGHSGGGGGGGACLSPVDALRCIFPTLPDCTAVMRARTRV